MEILGNSGVILAIIGFIIFFSVFLSASYRTQVGECADCNDVESGSSEEISTKLPGGEKAMFLAFGLCICVFKKNIGKLTVDPSCKGNLRIWLIDENAAPALQPVVTGQTYSADGFKIGNRTWKVDGSTCVTIKCTPQGVFAETCVNLIALALGKGAPTVVPAGTFGGPPKEPAAGAVAGLAT